MGCVGNLGYTGMLAGRTSRLDRPATKPRVPPRVAAGAVHDFCAIYLLSSHVCNCRPPDCRTRANSHRATKPTTSTPSTGASIECAA
jgi:hypothetical protein